MKRLLFEVHRWVGIALALFMLLWFFSGLVIIYAEPSTPTRAQQLAHAEPLSPESTWLSAGEAWARSTEHGNTSEADSKKSASSAQGIVEARLRVEADEAVWLIEDSKGQHFAVSASDGTPHHTSSTQALKIAENWIQRESKETDKPELNISFIETLDKPALLRNYDARPFHRIAVDDAAGSELLISARTGEVVSASTRIERGLYWAGNWVHLFRPLDLIGLGESRTEVLKWTAFAAVVASLTGLIVGWLRWRPGLFGKKTYSEGRVHPYRNFWFKWHFWGGLIGGLLALTWGLSGFLNGNPWQLFSPANPSKTELTRYVGGTDTQIANSWRAEPHVQGVNQAEIVELTWRRLGDETVQFAFTRDGRSLPQTPTGSIANFSEASLLSAVHRIAGDTPISAQSLVQEYDSYYYLRHHRDVADRPLPVLRIDLADAGSSYLYIDPQDGRLLLKQDRSRRVYRWLYSALHHWDIGWLYQRPLWDTWMLIWVILGLVLSVSAVVLGWRRLRHTFRSKHHAVQADEATLIEEQHTLATENQPG